MTGRRTGLLSAFMPAFRELRVSRRAPAVEHNIFYARSFDGVELFCTLLGSDADRVVVVAHPAVVGSSYGQVLALAEELARSFSVILFDFRGHGRSSGRCPLGFTAVSRDLEAVIRRAEAMGFEKIGVAGFSLGAAAAVLLSARDDRIDSLVSIGCPPRFPNIELVEAHPLAARIALHVLGMRIDPEPDVGPAPADVAALLPAIPKLLIFGEWEVAPPEEVSSFVEAVTEPKRTLEIPDVWHADLGGREALVREWFEETL